MKKDKILNRLLNVIYSLEDNCIEKLEKIEQDESVLLHITYVKPMGYIGYIRIDKNYNVLLCPKEHSFYVFLDDLWGEVENKIIEG